MAFKGIEILKDGTIKGKYTDWGKHWYYKGKICLDGSFTLARQRYQGFYNHGSKAYQ